RQAIASDRERLLRQKEVILTWKPGEVAETPFVVGDYRYEQSPVTGARTIVWSNRPKTLKLPVTDNGVPDLVVPRPQRFIVPAQWHEVIARIKAHGIRYSTLERPTEIAVTLYRMDDIKLADGFEPDR
ncbi:peptidase, partial [Pseudomonas aeruginosa]|nr:peptidase [Pseudomonas aeruginosa]